MLVYLRPVFWIRDILVRIRTRIRDAFQELVYPDPDSVLFVSFKMSPKINFFSMFFVFFLFLFTLQLNIYACLLEYRDFLWY